MQAQYPITQKDHSGGLFSCSSSWNSRTLFQAWNRNTALQKATGFSLFHSFQTRQGNLKKSRNLVILIGGDRVTVDGVTWGR